MKKFAAIKNDGSIVYTLSSSESYYEDGKIAGDYILREIPSELSEMEILNNYYWNNGWEIRPPIPNKYYFWDFTIKAWIPNLSAAKEDKIRSINIKRDKLLISSESALIYNENTFTNDSRTRFNISEALNLVNAGVSIPEGFVFRTADNINIPFNAEDIKNLAALSLFYKNACYQHSWELKNQIDQLTTVEEIEAFDINVGWP